MMDIEILPLKGYDYALQKQLGSEYSSVWGYSAGREQTSRGVIFTLIKRRYDQPVNTDYPNTDSDINWLSSVAGAEDYSFIALSGDKPAGVIICQSQSWNKTLFIRHLYVKTDFRKQGVASALVEKAEKAALSAGFRALCLEAQSKNGAALDFYSKTGFEIVGINTRFYTNNDISRGDVALFLHKSIG